jgi:hypothetical protein
VVARRLIFTPNEKNAPVPTYADTGRREERG